MAPKSQDPGSNGDSAPRVVPRLERIDTGPLIRTAVRPRPSPPPAPRRTDSRITWRDRREHWAARWGYRRNDRRVEPGLYMLGAPDDQAPVLVTANYKLSFDAVRAALKGRDAYILVLDTRGINVWCAAGKGTFGTDELARRIQTTGVDAVVSHRRLILPQLGAPGVSAQDVRRRTGYQVAYGPVRAEDVGHFIEHGEALPEMRRVRFDLRDRIVLIPVELVHTLGPMIVGAGVLWLLAGPWAAAGAAGSVLAGTVLFPLLLPWLPTRDFSSKGFLLGGVVALVAATGAYRGAELLPEWQQVARSLALLIGLPPVTAYLALNFTGATPLASQTAVRREMARYIRPMIAMAGLGAVALVGLALARWIGGA